MKIIHPVLVLIAISILLSGCNSNAKNNHATADFSSSSFNDYWNQGKAELSSFTLKQARYGEMHDAEMVLIFVTEDFSAEKHVKLDNPDAAGSDKVPVLKLNASKKFNTGLYPYSIMSSIFMPVDIEVFPHALKVTTSVQDWCGHIFMQINNLGESYHVSSKSYFESDADKEFELNANYLEDELWNIIRLNPNKLPSGKHQVIPSTVFTRLKHVDLKAYEAGLNLSDLGNGYMEYNIDYPFLKRTLIITFEKSFPYRIQGWEDEYISGWGASAKKLKTTATLNKRIITDYWTKNSPVDSGMRKELGLE